MTHTLTIASFTIAAAILGTAAVLLAKVLTTTDSGWPT